MPNRARSYLLAAVAMNSIAQHAVPNGIGHSELARPQLIAWSSVARVCGRADRLCDDFFLPLPHTSILAAASVVEGRLQKQDGTLSVKGDRFWGVSELEEIPSHDFH